MENKGNLPLLLYMFVSQTLGGLTLLPFIAIFGFVFALPISFAFDGFPFENFAGSSPLEIAIGIGAIVVLSQYPFWMGRLMLGSWLLYKSNKYKWAFVLSSIPIAIPVGLIVLIGILNSIMS